MAIRARACLFGAGLLVAVCAPVYAAPVTAGFDIVGRSSLGARGMNAALTIAGSCAYIGSRNDAPPEVVDISNPSAPRVASSLEAHPGSTPRELRAIPAARELVVLFYSLSGGPNRLDLYRWSNDCLAPVAVGHYSFGARVPHEMFLWRDPSRPARLLLYVTFFGAAGEGLTVLDISDPVNPSRAGGWTVPAAYGHAPVHSVAVSDDGREAFLSLWTGGLVVADTTDFADERPAPAVRALTPPAAVFKTPPGNVHSAVPIPGTTDVLTTDERYPAPYGAGCPFGTAHVVSVADGGHPVALASLAVPENTASLCAAATRGTWTSHNPTITAHLGLVSWYSAGLQVFQLDDPAHPLRLAELRPTGANPSARDLQLGVTDAMTWSYPVVVNGLIYVVDINQGLLVLRYHGPHDAELATTAFADGSSNLAAFPTSTASPAPTAVAIPPASPPRTPSAPGALSNHGGGTPWAALLLAVVVVAGLGGVAFVAVRRRRS